jgi:subtilisin-like proprotein convertase family protein
MQTRGSKSLWLTILLFLIAQGFVFAVQPANDKSDLRQKEFFIPELSIGNKAVSFANVSNTLSNKGAIDAFVAQYGSGAIHIDPRSGAVMSMTAAIPLIPGKGMGNNLTIQNISGQLGRQVDAINSDAVAELFRNFLIKNQAALGIDTDQLGPVRAEKINDRLWNINIQQTVNGIPVRWGRYVAVINGGNIILQGAATWGNVKTDTTPRITAHQAMEFGFNYVGGRLSKDLIWKQPTLELVPTSAKDYNLESGAIGSGYGHRLVYVFGFQRAPEHPRWEVMVDAHSAEVLAMEDKNHYIDKTIKGGVYPLTNTEICPDNIRCGILQPNTPMPYTNTGFAAPNDFTNSAGVFDYTSGTTTTSLSGPYVVLSDTCGVINATGAGDINMGGANGDHDCDTPTSGGNTAASRSGMYEVNKIFEAARGYLPTNPWLQGNQGGPLPTNMNINLPCNAFYTIGDPGTINFYRELGGCRNTGEIAAVFDHEWGHGMDDHDTGGSLSSSSEGYADIASMYRLFASCVGYGFFGTSLAPSIGCGLTADGTGANQDEAQTGASVCDLDCSGVRDADYTKITGGNPLTATFVCASCVGGGGPCGGQVHCSATPTREAAWNFVARELQNPPGVDVDANTAFIIGDKVFYQGSGNIGVWHNCTCPTTSDGCNADGGYLNWLAADDDDGNLNNGTPHMADIFEAFDTNGIACAAPAPTNAGCAGGPTTAPVVTGSPGSNSATLDWGAVPNAVQYNIYRTEGYVTDGVDKCAFGKALVGTTNSLSFTDPDVANGRAYSYVVMAEGANDACFGPASNCTTVTPQPCAGSVTIDSSAYSCNDTVNITVVDSDLIGDGTQDVEVTAGSDTETVTLNETPAGSGIFVGSINTSGSGGSSEDGTLNVVDGQTITVTYSDASFCGPPQDVEATASADCLAPLISNVGAENITESTADITWDTNELANSSTTFAPAPGPPSTTVDDLTNYVLNHSVGIGGLTACTDYVFSVASDDIAGNSVSDDNGGSFYSFTTNGLGTLFSDDAEAGIGNWISGGSPAANQWHVSTCDSQSGTNSFKAGPVACGAQYQNNVSVTLTSVQNYTIEAGSRLRFMENYSTESGFDFCTPQISTNGGSTWTNIDSYDGSSGGWIAKDYDLSSFAGANRKIRFLFTTDVSVTDTGWLVDDIVITRPAPCAAAVQHFSAALTDDCSGGGPGDGDGIIDPGETGSLILTAENIGLVGATNVTAVVTTTTPGVAINNGNVSFPDIPAESTQQGAPPVTFTVGGSVACGTFIDFQVEYTTDSGTFTDNFTLMVGQNTFSMTNYASTDVPKPIADAATTTSVLVVPDNFTVSDVDVTIDATHTWDGDLDIVLIGPGGSPVVELTSDNGGSGDNYTNTKFDDEAVTPITSGTPPYTGTFRPEGQLSNFDGISSGGTWTLSITDDFPADVGTLLSWSLDITANTGVQCNNCGGVCPTITLSPTTLPNGVLNSPYNQVITASGGTGPYTFAVSNGALPQGLNLAADGTLSGTPTQVEVANFTVTATDATLCTGSQSYQITVATCLFCDEFNDGIVDPNWTYIKSILAWLEANDALSGTTGRKPIYAFSSPLFVGAGCTNCSAETIMRMTNKRGSKVSFLFHVIDKKNLFEVEMDARKDKWTAKHRINNTIVAKSKFLATIDPDTDYTVGIRYDGTNFIVSIDGVDQITLAPGGPVTGGSVGFKVKKTTGTFQRIEVN